MLVVDDSPIQRRVHLALLHALGVPAEAVEDGAQAVAAVERGGIGLVLMDVDMPVLDGIEATRRIRALRIGQPRIVGVTASHPNMEPACREAGMDEFSAKPLTTKRLRRFLAQAHLHGASGDRQG